MDWLSVEQAADKLAIGPSQVRRLARQGDLAARRVGGIWLISNGSVLARRGHEPSSGRPLSPAMAWAVLEAIAIQVEDRPLDDAAPSGDRKERYRVRKLLAGAPPVDRWDQWLRRRAVPRTVWVHPGVVDRLAADRRLRPGGAFAVAAAGLGLGAGAQPDRFYVDADQADAVLTDYRGHDDPAGTLTLMVIPTDVPSELRPEQGLPIAPTVALVDLLHSPDARERHVAAERLGQAANRFKTTAP